MSAIRLFNDSAARESAPLVSDQPTVRQILDWNEQNSSRKVGSPAAEKERRRIWSMVRASLGDRLVADCRPFHLLDFINAELGKANTKKKVSDWSRRRWNTTIQNPFNRAEKLGLITKNPFRGLTFGEGGKGRDWTDNEYQSLLRNAPPVFRLFLVWMRFSGMRPGESREILRSHADRAEGIICIDQHKMRYLTEEPRYVPINHVLGKILDYAARHHPCERNVLLNSFGKPWTCRAITKQMRSLRQKIGLPDSVKCHGGRHTFITRGLMNGVDIPSMMELAGHGSIKTTQRYTHLKGKTGHLKAAMEKAVKTGVEV